MPPFEGVFSQMSLLSVVLHGHLGAARSGPDLVSPSCLGGEQGCNPAPVCEAEGEGPGSLSAMSSRPVASWPPALFAGLGYLEGTKGFPFLSVSFWELGSRPELCVWAQGCTVRHTSSHTLAERSSSRP